jgi:predicted nucleic acid-binding protein
LTGLPCWSTILTAGGPDSRPGDDYLIALARKADAQYIVSGDTHFTNSPSLPVPTPHQFLEARN